MGGTYSNLLCHIVFSTKERRQLLSTVIEPEVYAYSAEYFATKEPSSLRATATLIMYTCSCD